jgi:hemin uptake protein HemP
MPPHETEENAKPKAAQSRPDQPVRYEVAELLRGGREAVLEHDGADYRLRITANGRLILTK